MKASVLSLLFMIFAATAGADTPLPGPLYVTYVGNAGYLVAGQGHKVAIDALFGGWSSDEYDIPADSTVALMKSARPPFDDIDIIAVTHWNRDHFDAGIVAKNLKNNAHGVILCSQQVADKLATQPEYGEIQNRIHVVEAPTDSVVRYKQKGISALILSSRHGSYSARDSAGTTVDIHRNTRNLEFLLTLGERSFFHCGDATFEHKYRYRLIGLGMDSIDIAFVPKWSCEVLPTFAEKLVRECLLPKRIFFIHMAPGTGARLAAGPTCINYRMVTLPTRSLESWIIP